MRRLYNGLLCILRRHGVSQFDTEIGGISIFSCSRARIPDILRIVEFPWIEETEIIKGIIGQIFISFIRGRVMVGKR